MRLDDTDLRGRQVIDRVDLSSEERVHATRGVGELDDGHLVEIRLA